MTTREIWRSVPSIEGALVSNHGRVMRAPFQSENPRAGHKQYGGIPTVGRWDGDRFTWQAHGKNYKVARMVCEAFNGPAPFEGAVCMHLNEDSTCNTPCNLAWGTQKENLNAPGFIEYCKGRTGDNNPHIKGRKARAA
jgi:hypothetical protein